MKRLLIVAIFLGALFLGLLIIFFSLFPIKYTAEIKRYSSMYGLPAYVVASVINVESGYRVDARSHADAMGLMQLKLSTAQDMSRNTSVVVDENTIYDKDVNIELGSKYIAYLLDMFEGNEVNALASYNWGLQNVKEWMAKGNVDKDGTIKNIPVKETKMYLKKYKVCKYIYRDIYRLR